MVYGKVCGMEKTTLYLPVDLHRALKEHARRSGRAQAELVREALQAYLSEASWPQPGSIGAGADDGVSARESEEWLMREWDRAGHA
jgi:predicted transcriptional regulator